MTATETAPATLQSSPWAWWREQMPIARKWAYFDHAAVAPISRPAQRWLSEFAADAAELGDTVWPQWAAKIEVTRRNFAELLTADPAEIAITANTTAGINFVAEGWRWQTGDNVVIPEGEFPSNLFPWINQQDRGVEVRIVPRRGNAVLVEDLMGAVDQSTQIVAVSWVGFASGYRLDVGALVREAHERDTLVFLDAIQGLGIYDLNLRETPVDFLAADGHKWLLGPEGAGMAMIRREHLHKLRCGNVGWGSVKNSYNYNEPEFTLKQDASRYEAGSANMAGIGALAASLEIFLQIRRHHGPNAIGERVIALAQQLNEQMIEIGVETQFPESIHHQTGIVNFSVPGIDPNRVRSECLEKNIVVSCRGGGVRASIHAYNNADDLQRLVDVVRSLLAQRS